MKTLKKILLISTLAISSSAIAHSDGHGKVNPKEVIQIALKSAKMLTFKDHGMSVGKIDASWNNMSKEQFSIIERGDFNYTVKAINTDTKQELYFSINKAGEINDVKDGSTVSHGHAH